MSAATPTHRLNGDQGSLIPEFALAAPILVFSLLAVFEFGMAYRERINLTGAVRSAARQATNLGEARQADYEALQGLTSTMERAKQVEIDKVVIYHATSGGAPLASTCFTLTPLSNGQGVNDRCNIYGPSQLSSLGSTSATHFGGSGSDPNDDCVSTAWDRFWCPPTMRESSQGAPNGPDYLGVRVEATYTSYTSLLPTTIAMADQAVMRIEPKLEVG